MVGPIRFDGIFSGIDFTSIIEQLLNVQRRPIFNLQNRIADATARKTALLSVSANVLGIRSITTQLQKPSFLLQTTTSSSDESVLTASGNQIGVTGAFTFTVERLAQTHQLVSNGFSSDEDVVTTTDASITVEVGNGFLDNETQIDFLNGGQGVDRGFIQVTDTAGNVAVINLEGAVTVQDVLDKINTNTQVNVEARALADRFVVRDQAGGAGTLQIQDFGLDTTATDLGLAKTQTVVGGTSFIFGNDVNSLASNSRLSFLNDGLGVRRNSDGVTDFTVVTASGAAVEVDLKDSDVTIGDVVSRINAAASAAGSTLTASINEDATGLTITTAGGAGAASISAAADSLAAADLGLGSVSGTTFGGISAVFASNGAAAVSGELFLGNRLIGSLNSLLRRTLNGGQELTSATDIQGVRDGSLTVTDKQGDFVTVNVDAQTVTTLSVGVGAGAASVTLASVVGFAEGNKIRFAGGSGAGGDINTRTIIRISGTTVFFDQALGDGFEAGDSATAINESLGDIVNNVNFRSEAAGVDVSLRIDDSGNGLRARDTSGGAGSLSIVGAGGSAAGDLGISGTSATTVLDGTDLDPQYIATTTQLSTLNAGKGVQPGKIRVTDTSGVLFDVDLSQPDDVTIGAVIEDFNGAAAGNGSDVRARVNDTGDGILLSSSAPGGGTLTVAELGTTTTARDLNILGVAPTATPDTIDGSFERTVVIAAGTKLKDIPGLLNEANVGVQAALLNDGGVFNPFKLTLLSNTAGTDGRLVIDSDIAGLSFSTTTSAQDATLLFGTNQGTTDPLLITSSSNTVKDVVPGLTLDLKSASPDPVTITVSRDTDNIINQVQSFVDKYNDAVKTIRGLTSFDPDTNRTGILFSESVIRTVRRDLSDMITNPVDGIPLSNLRTFREIGVKVVGNGLISFDSSKLQEKLDNNFDEVVEFFTRQRPLKIDTPLEDLNNGRGVGNIDGTDDFRIIKRNGDFFDLSIDGVSTLGSLLNLVNNDPGNTGEIDATISPDGFSLRFTDSSALGRLADGGSTTTVVESDLIGSPIDFVGAQVTITSGADTGEVRFVTDFDSVTGTLTLDTALSVTASGETYDLSRALQITPLNTSTAAPDLRIAAKLELGENVLKGNLINLSGDPGKGFAISERLDFLTRPDDGLISTRTDGIDDSIDGFNDSIERLEERIANEETRLIREFARLEQLIASSQQTLSQLQAQQSSLLALAGGGGL